MDFDYIIIDREQEPCSIGQQLLDDCNGLSRHIFVVVESGLAGTCAEW
jgi:hypothetical protein